jgi:hypothetical protein
MGRLDDLHVMKTVEAQVPFMSVPGGFVEVLQLGGDFHLPARRAGLERCTPFEIAPLLRAPFEEYCSPLSYPVTMSATRAEPRLDRVCRQTDHSENLSGAKRHVR